MATPPTPGGGSCQAKQPPSRRRRFRMWNHNATIPFERQDSIDNVVRGEALLCFARDGSSFTGNMVTQRRECVFKIHGSKVENPLLLEQQPKLPQSDCRCRTATTNNDDESSSSSPTPASLSTSSSANVFSSNSESSDGSSVDEQVSKAMADLALDLDFEDDEDESDENVEKNAAYYSVNVVDMETGIKYTVDNVKVVRKKLKKHKKRSFDTCKLGDAPNHIRFVSTQRLYGASADLVINGQLGPDQVEKHLIAYTGEMRFTYRDPVCFPVSSINETQWCL